MKNNLSDKTICTVTTGPGADACEPQLVGMDQMILVTGHHPDEDTVELSVFRPEPQTIVLLKSELPFVVGALQDYIKD